MILKKRSTAINPLKKSENPISRRNTIIINKAD